MQPITITEKGFSSLCSYALFLGEDFCTVTVVIVSCQNSCLAAQNSPYNVPPMPSLSSPCHNLSWSLSISDTFFCTWPKDRKLQVMHKITRISSSNSLSFKNGISFLFQSTKNLNNYVILFKRAFGTSSNVCVIRTYRFKEPLKSQESSTLRFKRLKRFPIEILTKWSWYELELSHFISFIF